MSADVKMYRYVGKYQTHFHVARRHDYRRLGVNHRLFVPRAVVEEKAAEWEFPAAASGKAFSDRGGKELGGGGGGGGGGGEKAVNEERGAN